MSVTSPATKECRPRRVSPAKRFSLSESQGVAVKEGMPEAEAEAPWDSVGQCVGCKLFASRLRQEMAAPRPAHETRCLDPVVPPVVLGTECLVINSILFLMSEFAHSASIESWTLPAR